MSNISVDIVNGLSEHQPQIWQTVSKSISENVNAPLSFASPLTVASKASDLYSEFGSPMLVLQFSFADLQENSQLVLVPQETFLSIAEEIREEPVAEIDDHLVDEVRPAFEALVQGICIAVSNIRGEAVVVSNLSIRFQLVSFPANFQKSIEVLRTQVGITANSRTGTVTWLCDGETAHHILGLKAPAESDAFPQLAPGTQTSASKSGDDSLNLLMDIPLEISVELGRVKMLVRDVVELGTGSIVEIDKAAGEPVDVMLNGRLVARGEVVVIEDNFGVRLTEILNPQERLNRLGEVA
jgi:flagellar motor switch protein FliN/FliY